MTRHHIIISNCFQLQSRLVVYKGYQRWSKILTKIYSNFGFPIIFLFVHQLIIISMSPRHGGFSSFCRLLQKPFLPRSKMLAVTLISWSKHTTIHFVFFNALFCQQRNNNVYLSMVQAVLQTDNFYFSCSYDLTHTLQRLSRTSPDFLQMPLFERVCNTTGKTKVLTVL